MTDEIALREITRDTLREILRLKVAPQQEKFVASNAVSIAQAHFHPETAWFRGIHAGDAAVGLVMLEDDPRAPGYSLWRFMIDAGQQGKGYGRRAL
jgi:diamine N-acetyltransferase